MRRLAPELDNRKTVFSPINPLARVAAPKGRGGEDGSRFYHAQSEERV